MHAEGLVHVRPRVRAQRVREDGLDHGLRVSELLSARLSRELRQEVLFLRQEVLQRFLAK